MDETINCPECMNIFHLKCVKERIIKVETLTGREKITKVYYSKCPICRKEISKI